MKKPVEGYRWSYEEDSKDDGNELYGVNWSFVRLEGTVTIRLEDNEIILQPGRARQMAALDLQTSSLDSKTSKQRYFACCSLKRAPQLPTSRWDVSITTSRHDRKEDDRRRYLGLYPMAHLQGQRQFQPVTVPFTHFASAALKLVRVSRELVDQAIKGMLQSIGSELEAATVTHSAVQNLTARDTMQQIHTDALQGRREQVKAMMAAVEAHDATTVAEQMCQQVKDVMKDLERPRPR